jgi:hypothetical protein
VKVRQVESEWLVALIVVCALVGVGLILILPERSKAVDLVYQGF